MANMTGMRVQASGVRPTDTGVDGGVDLDVTCEINGLSHEGEVTLVPSRNGEYVAYGNSADMWVSGGLLSWLADIDEGRELADLLSDLESVAARSAEARVQS
jgi:hypothetical protein